MRNAMPPTVPNLPTSRTSATARSRIDGPRPGAELDVAGTDPRVPAPVTLRSFRWRVLTGGLGVVALPVRSVTHPVDLGDLRQPGPAAGAPGQMSLHAGGIPGRQASAYVAAQPVAGPPALRVIGHRDMLLQVQPPQPLPRPMGEHRDRVGCQSELRGDLGRARALDLGLPQDVLPALGQLAEGTGGVRALEP